MNSAKLSRYAFVIIAIQFSISSSLAQSTTFGFWNNEITRMKTYLLIGEMVPQQAIDNALLWDISAITPLENSKPEAIVTNDQNLFVLPVTEEIEKGVRNYKFILARGKAGLILPRHKDEMGFYMGGIGSQALASVYVDTAKVKTSFACLYLSALNSLIKYGAQFSSQAEMTDFLKENYWFENMSKVHFEASDMMAPLNDSTTLVSVMPHGLVHSHEGYNNDLGNPGREDCFADLIEVREKGGKVAYQAFFFSYSAGLVYHDVLSPEEHQSALFNKKDIHKYGTPQVYGKKK